MYLNILEEPFFVYYASPGVHAPHHVTGDWVKKYEGEFDKGWDATRQETLARQIEMGIVPANTQLAKPADSIVNWESLTDDQKKVYARQAEAFAGFAEYSDFHVGRLVDAIEEMDDDPALINAVHGTKDQPMPSHPAILAHAHG